MSPITFYPYYEVTELVKSRKTTRTSEGSTIVRTFRVKPIDDPEWILMYLPFLPQHNQQHPWLPFMFVDTLEINPVPGVGCDIFITYKEFPLGYTPYSEQWNWDIVSAQTKVYSVWDESYILHYPESMACGTAIGFNGQQADGADVYRPSMSLNVTKVVQGINQSQRNVLEGMLNTVNDSYWFDYLPGEVLYTGSQIRRRPDGFVQVDLSFLVAPTRPVTPVQLWDGTTIPVAVRPWDYVWFQYRDSATLAGSDTSIKKRIKSIHIAQVYAYTNFGIFGLGGPYG